MEEMYTCFPPRSLGVDIVSSMVICGIYRARPHLNPFCSLTVVYTRLFLLRPLSLVFFLSQWNPSLEVPHVLYSSMASMLSLYDWDHTRSSPRPLRYKTHLYERGSFDEVLLCRCDLLGLRNLEQIAEVPFNLSKEMLASSPSTPLCPWLLPALPASLGPRLRDWASSSLIPI